MQVCAKISLFFKHPYMICFTKALMPLHYKRIKVKVEFKPKKMCQPDSYQVISYHLLMGSCTSVLMTNGLFPRLSRKWRGDNIVPNSWKSPILSLSVSVVAEIPASGPKLGREPAVTDGSGICPGITSDSTFITAVEGREWRWTSQTNKNLKHCVPSACYYPYFIRGEEKPCNPGRNSIKRNLM